MAPVVLNAARAAIYWGFPRQAPQAGGFPLLVLALLLILPWACRADGPIVVINTAEFTLSDAVAPPQNPSWVTQALPDNWNRSRPGIGGNAWYRLRFHLHQPPQTLYAVYVRKLSMNAEFYVNGELVGSGGSFREPVARNWNRPQLFAIPGAMLKAGINTLHVRLWAYPNSRGGLDEVFVGPESALRPRYEWRYFVQTVFPQLCNILVAALGLFAFALWARRRTESVYAYFFAFTLLWAVRSTHMYIRDIPISGFYWDIWVQSSFGWCALLFIVLAMRYCRLYWRRFEIFLLIYAGVGPLAMYLAGPSGLHSVASDWSFFIVPVAVVFEGFLVRAAWRTAHFVDTLLAVVWALIILASVHDGLMHRDLLPFDSFYLVSYGMVLLSFVLGWLLTNRFVEALKLAERLNAELEQRVAEKHGELEQTFRRLNLMESEKAITEERRRIMGDMHDGVGSQLIAAIQLVESSEGPGSEIVSELRECLDSLRLTVDSLEEANSDLLTVLGNFRYRLEGRLKKQGIRLEWQVSEVPEPGKLSPQNVLHILRILQEAFTNIIKHAHASTVSVKTGATEDSVYICIADNGRGFAGQRRGRGLANMQRRAAALNARLEVQPSSGGTRIVLLMPL